jgi:hypothetical protein
VTYVVFANSIGKGEIAGTNCVEADSMHGAKFCGPEIDDVRRRLHGSGAILLSLRVAARTFVLNSSKRQHVLPFVARSFRRRLA